MTGDPTSETAGRQILGAEPSNDLVPSQDATPVEAPAYPRPVLRVAAPVPAPAQPSDPALWASDTVTPDSWASADAPRPAHAPAHAAGPAHAPAPRRPRHSRTRAAAKVARSAARTRRKAVAAVRPRPVRRALGALIALALIGTFFAWVSAEPIWLALGRGENGVATVLGCRGDGLRQRCAGVFTAADGAYTTETVRLLGVDSAQRAEGTRIAARMLRPGSTAAYLGDGTVMTLRWLLGLLLVVACGLGIVWATGALRLENRKSRRRAAVAGLAAPLLVTLGFLATTF